MKATRRYQWARITVAALIASSGCTTVRQEPIGALPELPPDYIHVPHPEGLDRADLVAIFTDLKAPSPEKLKDCDSDFMQLRAATASPKERSQGARELIRKDPVGYHWCFYGKLVQLDEKMKNDVYIDEKQKDVLQTYVFLTPIGRAFMEEFSDTRYLRWAVNRYKQLSHYVFYRQVDLTPRATEELASATNPFGAYRPSKDEPMSVLLKYGISRPPVAVAAPTSPTSGPAVPGAESTPVAPSDAAAGAVAPVAGVKEKEKDLTDPALPSAVAQKTDPVLQAVDPLVDRKIAAEEKVPAPVPVATPSSDVAPAEAAAAAPPASDIPPKQ